MPRTPEANQDLRDERRTELLHAAAKVFAQKGFVRTKISDIAKLAGVSHGLVYNYFSSKEAIFDEILEQVMCARRAPFERGLVANSEKTVFSQIQELADLQLAHIAEPQAHTQQLVVQAMMQGGVPEYIVRKLERHIVGIQKKFCGWIELGQAEGSIDRNQSAEVLTAAFFALFRGLWIRPITKTAFPYTKTSSDVVMRLLAPVSAASVRSSSSENKKGAENNERVSRERARKEKS